MKGRPGENSTVPNAFIVFLAFITSIGIIPALLDLLLN